MIIDSHVHVVSSDQESYPLAPVDLPNGAWYLDRPVDVSDLSSALDAVGVDAAVLVQAKGAYDYDNSYVMNAASSSKRFTSVGVADPKLADSVERLRVAGLHGARLFDIPLGTHAGLAESIEACCRNGIVAVPTAMLEAASMVADGAASNPGAVVAVDHCFFAALDDPDDRDLLQALFVQLPNVHFKVTSHVLLHCGDPVAAADWLVGTFGAGRLLWGSDFPQTPDASYRELLDLARRATVNFDQGQRTRFFGGTALSLWPELGS